MAPDSCAEDGVRVPREGAFIAFGAQFVRLSKPEVELALALSAEAGVAVPREGACKALSALLFSVEMPGVEIAREPRVALGAHVSKGRSRHPP